MKLPRLLLVTTLIRCSVISSVGWIQPFYSTRVNASDIDNRVKQLDEAKLQQQDGDGEKNKAGFWEEFDVRLYIKLTLMQFDSQLAPS